MDKWVVIFKKNTSLFAAYETIEGKNALDAIKRKTGKQYKRVYGDEGRYADIILAKGYYDKQGNNIHYKGKYQQLYYCEVS